jgi:hypothetical protein
MYYIVRLQLTIVIAIVVIFKQNIIFIYREIEILVKIDFRRLLIY